MPNILFLDGFDLYNGVYGNTALQSGWTISANSYNPYLSAGRFGGQCFSWTYESSAIYRTFTATPTITAGTAVKFDNLVGMSANVRTCVTLSSAGNTQIGWRPNPNGSISVYRMTDHTTGTLIQTTAADVLRSNVWQWVDFSVTISTTVGTVDLRVDGAVVLSMTAQNTQGYVTTASVDGIYLGSQGGGLSGSNQCNFDDVFAIDSITPLGERRVETIRPSADTATKDWTPNAGTTNFSRVNDPTVNTGTFVSASVVGNLDLYDMVDLNSNPTNIDAVQVTVWAQKTDAGSRSIAIVGDIGGVQVVSANLALAASIAKYTSLLATKPGGGAWDATSVNALRAGPKVTV